MLALKKEKIELEEEIGGLEFRIDRLDQDMKESLQVTEALQRELLAERNRNVELEAHLIQLEDQVDSEAARILAAEEEESAAKSETSVIRKHSLFYEISTSLQSDQLKPATIAEDIEPFRTAGSMEEEKAIVWHNLQVWKDINQ